MGVREVGSSRRIEHCVVCPTCMHACDGAAGAGMHVLVRLKAMMMVYVDLKNALNFVSLLK